MSNSPGIHAPAENGAEYRCVSNSTRTPVFCPLVILDNRNACRYMSKKNKTPNIPQEHRPRDDVCQCYVLGPGGRKSHTLLNP